MEQKQPVRVGRRLAAIVAADVASGDGPFAKRRALITFATARAFASFGPPKTFPSVKEADYRLAVVVCERQCTYRKS
jgi:hypothetical protein